MIFVKDLVVCGDAESLQKAINDLIEDELAQNKYIQIISVVFIGNNPKMDRIYQIIYKYM